MNEYNPGDPPYVDPQVEVTQDDKLWALLAHLSYLVGLGIIAPLVIWLVKRETSAFVEDQAKEALNFQLAVMIVALVASVTCIGIPVAIVVGIGGLVYSVIAAMESNKGIAYRYPYTFRIVQ